MDNKRKAIKINGRLFPGYLQKRIKRFLAKHRKPESLLESVIGSFRYLYEEEVIAALDQAKRAGPGCSPFRRLAREHRGECIGILVTLRTGMDTNQRFYGWSVYSEYETEPFNLFTGWRLAVDRALAKILDHLHAHDTELSPRTTPVILDTYYRARIVTQLVEWLEQSNRIMRERQERRQE